mgnify:CR=1 FL=1
MKRFICNYIVINTTQHTNSVLCVDNGTFTVQKFDVETPATLYVEGAIVVAPASALPGIKAIVTNTASIHEALENISPLTAFSVQNDNISVFQVTFSPKNVRLL